MLQLSRGLCPKCECDIIVAVADGVPTVLYDQGNTQMLVIANFLTAAGGEPGVALGPCQVAPAPLHAPREVPIAYYGHLKHVCGVRLYKTAGGPHD